jgi:D-glycero-alpha-D-manno-heptose 1-phosphate guanylyltransferase
MTTAIVLAGGFGTRLRGVVDDVPKPMAPIKGRPFLEYQLDYWIGQGVGRFILAVGFMHEKVQAHFGSTYGGAHVEYSVETSPLDTGGAVLQAAALLNSRESFLLLNGDTFFTVPLAELQAFAQDREADWCFSLFRIPAGGRYMAMGLGPDGKVVALNAKNDIRGLANGGVYWVSPAALSGSGFSAGERVSLEREIFPAALAAGRRMYGIEFTGTFLDIGLPSDYHSAPDILGA